MDVFNAKQNARNKHKSSQSKRKNHGPKRGGKTSQNQQRNNQTPKKYQPTESTIDQLINISTAEEDENVPDISDTEIDPLSKDFRHLLSVGRGHLHCSHLFHTKIVTA